MKKEKEKTPNEIYVAMTENSRAINDFSTLGCAGQQMLLARMTAFKNAEDEDKKIKNLTK